MFQSLTTFWKNWKYKGITYAAMLALTAFFLIGALAGDRTPEPEKQAETVLPAVTAQTLQEISDGATVDAVADTATANSAPLVARLGGRVTSVHAELGSAVRTGSVVIGIDGGAEANPARVQAQNAAITLGLFADIEEQTRLSLENAIEIAQHTYDLARTGQPINRDLQVKNQQLAQTNVAKAEAAREQAIDLDDEHLEKSASIGIDAAKLAASQAALSARLANQQSANATRQALEGLEAARIARDQTLANLASQRAGLEAQARSAGVQVRLMQVIAPFAGEVTSLSVRVGDFVRAGQTVGEVSGPGSTLARAHVSRAVREALAVGMRIPATSGQKTVFATVTAIADRQSGATGLWQADFAISEHIAAGQSVTIHLPLTRSKPGTIIVPLDAVQVRQNGAVILAAQEGVAHEYAFTPSAYHGAYVEGTADIPTNARIIIRGSRTLQDGDRIAIAE